jgi:hypothetical protein
MALFVAWLIGGWVAGRIARYRGGLHGLLTAAWMIVLAAIVAALGAWFGAEFNVFQDVALPQWFSADALATGALISGIVAILAMLVGGWLGGRWAERSRESADLDLVESRHGVAAQPGGVLGRRAEGDRL